MIVWEGKLKIDMKLLYEAYTSKQIFIEKGKLNFDMNKKIYYDGNILNKIVFTDGVDINSEGICFCKVVINDQGNKLMVYNREEGRYDRQLLYKKGELILK